MLYLIQSTDGVPSTGIPDWIVRRQASNSDRNLTCLRAGARGVPFPTTAAAAQGTHSGVLRTIGG